MKYQRRHDTVIIIGSHPGTRDQYDWSRNDGDVWVFNEAVKTETNSGFAPEDKVAGVFQLHKPVIWKNPNNRNDKNHYKWLQETTIPVFMQDESPEVPASVKYPLDEITSTLTDKLLTSSVAQAMVLAAYLGYKRVEIYGVEMETNTEYATQRPGVAFWAGYLMGLGIEVDAHWKIFDTLIYGFDGDVTFDKSEIENRIAELTPDCDRLKTLYEEQHKKVAEILSQCVQTGSMDAGRAFSENIITLVQMGQEFGHLDGMRQENERYLVKAEAMIAEAGEFVISRQEYEGSLVAHGKGAQKALSDYQVNGGKFEALFNNMMQTQSTKNRIKRMKRLEPFLEEYIKSAIRASMYAGAAEENRRYLAKLDAHIMAAGGAKSEAVLMGVES